MHISTPTPKQGTIKITITTPDDLWTLSTIIEPQDQLTATTERKIKIGTEKTSITKKTITLTINVEKTELNPSNLRVSGKITEGKEDIPQGSYHTLTLEPSTTFSLTKKNWPRYQLERLKEATKDTSQPLLLVAFDREEAYIARTTSTGHELLTHLQGEPAKKRITTQAKNFYKTIIETIKEYDKRIQPSNIILASPSFWKEELQKELGNDPIKKKIILATISSADETAINEILTSKQTQQALTQSHATHDINLVEKLLEAISKKNNKAIYGIKDVTNAANTGAISDLLITDTFINTNKEQKTYEQIDQILKQVDNTSGTIHIISSNNTGGKKLNGLGGIAAFLRYTKI